MLLGHFRSSRLKYRPTRPAFRRSEKRPPVFSTVETVASRQLWGLVPMCAQFGGGASLSG